MHETESVFENEIHKCIWDIEMLTDHPILAIGSDLVSIKKKKKIICHLMEFTVPVRHSVNIEEIEDQYFDLAKEMKKL